ncbi:MAG: hypothetical protein KC587_19785, partial [Nitrospira sp.]|nr:hypothetical protein [Nitrospira sp.]
FSTAAEAGTLVSASTGSANRRSIGRTQDMQDETQRIRRPFIMLFVDTFDGYFPLSHSHAVS